MTTRLKSLELHGYKTFALRTVFEFSGQITAIVGPNGSGKSNIADSIRWVLGEQSYSLLRGHKTEDMIFAGSEQRSRAGMASASILFDNEDGWLPIDFSEVTIARRAYRDGQNEYLLNGQKVRLKEISELLAQSGLAERTYTVIGQGLVDAALSLRPEERRRFFEEAAGIGLYRHRREESLNRLETTHRNMDRVLDILSEIEPRLSSLEKAAKRVQEYERIQADLHVLLREWYGFHWHKSQDDLKHAQDVFHQQEKRTRQARQHLIEVDKQVEIQRAIIQKLRSDLNNWHAQSAELHQKREATNRSLAVMDERQRSLLEQKQNFQSDLTRLEEEEKAHLGRLHSLQEEIEHLKDELFEAQTQAEKARINLKTRQAEKAKSEKSLRDARDILVSIETKQVRLKAHQNELVNRQESQRNSQMKTTQILQKDEQAMQVAQDNRKRVDEARIMATEEHKKVETELQNARNQIIKIESERKQTLEERSRLNAERTRVQAQLEILEQAEKSLSGFSQGPKYVLEASRKGNLKGRYRALSSELEVPAEYEKAIAAVLGEYVSSIILDHQMDAEAVLLLLAEREKGRTILLPADVLKTTTPIIPPVDPDCLGNAIDLIRFSDSLQPFLQTLLGHVLIVRDRSAAHRLLNGLPGTACVVTLQGEVFWGSGIIIAGQDSNSGMIARPRQKRELQEKLSQVKGELVQIDQKVQEYEKLLRHQQTILDGHDKGFRLSGQQLNQAVQAYQRSELEVEQTRQRVEWQRSQLVNMEAQFQQLEKEMEQTTGELKTVDASIDQTKEQIRQLTKEMDSLPLEEFQAEEAHWNTSAAVASRALQGLEKQLEEYNQTLTNNQQQQQVIRQRYEVTSSSLEQLDAEKTIRRSEEHQLNGAIESLQQEIEPAEQDLEMVEKKYAQLQGNQSTAQQAVSAAERNETQSQLELARQREAVESLRRRIEEDFGLVAFEYQPDVSGQTPLPLEGIVMQLPAVAELSPEIEEGIARFRSQLRRMGAINPDAQKEYKEVLERYQFLTNQMEDLKKADIDLRQVINELDELMKIEFRKTFDAVAHEFREMFTRLFGGGTARLNLTDEDHPTETGIEIQARLPGRREQGLELLSGGERSLTAVALVFALLKVSPTPFCVLDEVDAMLDESNVGRFSDLLRELSQKTQFIVVTHNRGTANIANIIYGVTMGRDSASQVISLKLDEINEEMIRQ